MKRDALLNIALALLTLCAVVVTVLLVRREFFPVHPVAVRPQNVPDWREFVREGHMMGPANAPVKIVVFSDFQCPFCAVLAERLRALRAEYPTQVAVVYRHFPLRMHPFAIAAARASECAAAQGRFEPYHDALFATQDSIGLVSWEHFASVAGVRDSVVFRECITRMDPLPTLARDTLAGRRLNVTVTPTLLINETLLQGSQSLATLGADVERVLHRSSSAGSRRSSVVPE